MKSAKRPFDPQAFLAKVGTGKTISKYRKGRIIYAQGEEADRIFYIQSGKVKVTVVSEQGKEAVVSHRNEARHAQQEQGRILTADHGRAGRCARQWNGTTRGVFGG